MKRRLKKLNRGLVLGALFTLGVIIYVKIDYARFEEETPEIRETIESYIDEIEQLTVTTDSLNKLKDTDVYDNMVDVVDHYWCSQTLTDYEYFIVKSDMMREIKVMFEEELPGYVTDVEYKLSSTKVRKGGPNVANVTCTVDATYITTGNCYFLTLSGYDSSNGSYDEFGNPVELADGELIEETRQYEYTFKLYRTDDGWKIGKADYWWNNSGSTLITESEVDA